MSGQLRWIPYALNQPSKTGTASATLAAATRAGPFTLGHEIEASPMPATRTTHHIPTERCLSSAQPVFAIRIWYTGTTKAAPSSAQRSSRSDSPFATAIAITAAAAEMTVTSPAYSHAVCRMDARVS